MSAPLAAKGAAGKGPCAFVLSGGGSLGAVQVGMLRALFEYQVRPDFVIGTSVGAVNSAWIAGHPDQDGVLELGEIWMGLRRQDVFPLSPITGARGLLGRSNHFIANDNLRALSFYLRRGYRLTRLHLDGMERVRAAKPQVPQSGAEGIALQARST